MGEKFAIAGVVVLIKRYSNGAFIFFVSQIQILLVRYPNATLDYWLGSIDMILFDKYPINEEFKH